MNIKPLSNHILIEFIEEEKTTKSGIIIADTVEKKPVQAKVLAVGPGKRDEKGNLTPVAVKAGDRVLFRKYAPDEMELDGKKVAVIEESDVLAVIE